MRGPPGRVGEISGPVLLRFRVKNPLVVPNMHLLVSGRTPPPQSSRGVAGREGTAFVLACLIGGAMVRASLPRDG